MNTANPLPQTPGLPETDLQRHLESTCKELNLRIARLSIALGISLDDEHAVEQVLHHHHSDTEVPAAVRHPHHSAAPSHTAAQREDQRWDELRALILMRDGMEQHCVEELGPAAAGDILLSVEQQMDRQGFRHGADGMDLGRLLGVE